MRQLVILAVGARQQVILAFDARQVLFPAVDARQLVLSTTNAPTRDSSSWRRANWYIHHLARANW
jgi:hypothetical protein